ncbi:alcohol dehydrogenase [Microdochium trichocladiopsis]|uniref:Alcohol dehydrogenase n=1 Tax=Microdochium trichocladiopsis TaxID=1682393 RepID=A0A9P8XZP0_9PEZI|nr:alcohol dehydrogenase [Microdochium trichocladiopsis]KAH7024598.1 alcohol dehydrogenase [Microdochium trichocladiopsis]
MTAKTTTNGHHAPEIPKECLAGVVVNEGPDFRIEVKKVPVPEIGPQDVLIKLSCTGLCMSDVHYALHDWDSPSMSSFGTQCPGHEGAGEIVAVGSDVKNLKVGQRAGFKPVADVCYTCEACRTGHDNYCLGAKYTGLHVDGSYKQYVASPARYTTIIPDSVPDHVAGPVMCSASTMYTAIRSSGATAGQWACFPGGGGGVGIQGVQLAVAMGLRAVVVDTGSERRELALKMGAEEFVDFKEVQDPARRVVEITGGGAHVCFVTAVQAYPTSLSYIGYRMGGVVMCIGMPPKDQHKINLFPTSIIVRGQSIKGTMVSSLADVDATLEFARRGKLKLEPTVVGLSKWDEAVQKLKRGEVAGRIVVDFSLP